jgi:hypothetical protein
MMGRGSFVLADERSETLKRSPGMRFRLPAMIAAMTLLALLAALAGPYFRQQSAVAQRSLVAYWLVTLAVAIGGFAWRWRLMTTPNSLMGTAHWQATLVSRRWWLGIVWRIGAFAALAAWLGSEAGNVVQLHDRFANGPASRWIAVALRGTFMGWIAGIGIVLTMLNRPAFICSRGVWALSKEVVWSKLAEWQWLPDRPGVMKLTEAKIYGRSRELFIAIPAELRLEVEDYVREKTELTIPDARARSAKVDDVDQSDIESI